MDLQLTDEEDPDFVLDGEDNSTEDSDFSFDDEPQIGDELPDYAAVDLLLPTRHNRIHGASTVRGRGAGTKHAAVARSTPKVL